MISLIPNKWIRASLIAMCVFATACPAAKARTQLKNICRIKGQEEITLRGPGLVVGLTGTGEAGDPLMMAALAQSMRIMHIPVGGSGKPGDLSELKKIKNAAIVMVTANVPATGARRGDKVTCYVSQLNGKSLDGGRLMFAALQGTNTEDSTPYATCEGQITIDDPDHPTVGTVHGGCQFIADIFTPFYQNGMMTLVLDRNHANFQTAAGIAKEIDRKFHELSYADDTKSSNPPAGSPHEPQQESICQALDAANIVVRIPRLYRDDPVDFASDVLDMTLQYDHEPEARVVINPRAGSIVISGEVEIGDVVVTHKNIVVEAAPSQRFASVDTNQSNNPKLKQLVDQLNSLKVPTTDMIEIIRGIDRDGKLHGRLIIE